ncbi:ANTAR domain-containing response regulator [Inquilinus limosus]|uniref:ANTAR domain-containing response regulator n=1 Tax=Inquilinus limosus TaxID=171674 RepID=UPI003F5CEC8E
MVLRILLVDENAERCRVVEAALTAAGHGVVTTASGTENLLARVREIEPDVIIVDLDAPNRDALEHMRSVSRERPKPIVMFVDQSDDAAIGEAIRAGVSAYVVDGLSPHRVKPVLEAAIARFQAFQAMRDELEKTRATLAERKRIERAKGILMMQQRGMTEDEAYRALRKLAMDRGKPLAEIAEQVISISELLTKN